MSGSNFRGETHRSSRWMNPNHMLSTFVQRLFATHVKVWYNGTYCASRRVVMVLGVFDRLDTVVMQTGTSMNRRACVRSKTLFQFKAIQTSCEILHFVLSCQTYKKTKCPRKENMGDHRNMRPRSSAVFRSFSVVLCCPTPLFIFCRVHFMAAAESRSVSTSLRGVPPPGTSSSPFGSEGSEPFGMLPSGIANSVKLNSFIKK